MTQTREDIILQKSNVLNDRLRYDRFELFYYFLTEL